MSTSSTAQEYSKGRSSTSGVRSGGGNAGAVDSKKIANALLILEVGVVVMYISMLLVVVHHWLYATLGGAGSGASLDF